MSFFGIDAQARQEGLSQIDRQFCVWTKASRYFRFKYRATAAKLKLGLETRPPEEQIAAAKAWLAERRTLLWAAVKSTMVHPEKDWAFIALRDDGSLWLYRGSWSRIENIPRAADL